MKKARASSGAGSADENRDGQHIGHAAPVAQVTPRIHRAAAPPMRTVAGE
jgi:hypothetical protein